MAKKWLNTINGKLTFFSLVLVCVLIGISAVAIFSLSNVTQKYNAVVQEIFQYNLVSTEFDNCIDFVELDIRLSNNTQEYEQFKKRIIFLEQTIDQLEAARANDAQWSKIRGLKNMILTYSEATQHIVDKSRLRHAPADEIAYCREVAKFVHARIYELIKQGSIKNIQLYDQVQSRTKSIIFIISVLIIALLIAAASLILYFKKNMTEPIIKLAHQANRIASGEYGISTERVESTTELSELTDAFNLMSKNVEDSMNQIQKRIELEAKLSEEEIENIRITNLLKSMELKALQSQINPHFLFNTLNTISHMALLENAVSTQTLVETTSDLLRYNLKKSKKGKVTLKSEIENLSQYIYIQTIRFFDRIRFTLDVQEDDLGLEVPHLILQPLVENAILHGIEEKEGIGTIHIAVRRSEDFRTTIIEMSDDGVGISPEQISCIFEENDDVRIGIVNVKKRLEYFYRQQNLLKIESEKWKYTKITLYLPRGVSDHV